MAVDMLLEIKSVKGQREPIPGGFASEPAIEILGWQWSLRQDKNLLQSAQAGVASAKTTVRAIEIEKYVDQTTPHLLQLCADGGSPDIAVAGIWCFQTVEGKRHPYYKIKLGNPVIQSVELGEAKSDGVILEKLTLTFASFEVMQQGWDSQGNKAMTEIKTPSLDVLKGPAGK